MIYLDTGSLCRGYIYVQDVLDNIKHPSEIKEQYMLQFHYHIVGHWPLFKYI